MNRWSHLLRRAGALGCLVAGLTSAQGAEPLLLRHPSLSQDRIAFLYADDVWTVSREGGEARRLTSVNSVVDGPFLSPDGKQILYSAHQQQLTDVYVVSADGGVPRRLTWEPTGNYAVGWTADGKDVLFASAHASYSDFPRLFRTHADGTGTPVVLPLPSANEGTYSADGNTLAYVPVAQWEPAWKHYRGGQTTPVWLVNMKTLDLEKIPRQSSNDSSPVWEGAKVYFLSDRNGPVSLFSYDTGTKAVELWSRIMATTSRTWRLAQARWSMSSSGPCTSMTWPRVRSTRCRLPFMETCLR